MINEKVTSGKFLCWASVAVF